MLPNGSLVVAIEASASFGVFSLMLLKIYIVVIKNRENLTDILERIEFHFPIHTWNQHYFKVGKYLKLLNIFIITTTVIYSMLWLQNSCMAFLEILYGWMTSRSIKIELILRIYVPFDYSNPLVFSLIYIFQSWILLVNLTGFLLVDMMYFGLMIVLSMEFDMLKEIMSEIDPRDDQQAAIKKMKELIEIHQELIEITEKLEDIFSLILFVNIFGMVYLICETAFLSIVSIITRIIGTNCIFLTLQSGISQYLLIKYFLTFIGSCWNGFIQCYFGERLIR